MGPSEARERARYALASVVSGGDPAQERKAFRAAPVVADLANTYLEVHALPKKRPASVRNDKSMLGNHILPAIGQRKLRDVSAEDVQRLEVQQVAG